MKSLQHRNRSIQMLRKFTFEPIARCCLLREIQFNQGPSGEGCAGPHADVQGGITASMPGGSFVGALISGFLSDILGRKRAIQVGAVIWFVCFHAASSCPFILAHRTNA